MHFLKAFIMYNVKSLLFELSIHQGILKYVSGVSTYDYQHSFQH